MQEEKVVRKRILAVASALILCLGLTGTALAGKQERTVYAGTVEELQDALASNTRIILEGRDYSIGSLGIQNLENVTIQGTEGTRILTQYEGNFALDIGASSVVLENLAVCLDPPEGTWHDTELFIVGVLSDSRLTLQGCEIIGCLMSCAIGEGCSFTVKDTVFRDCPRGIMKMCAGQALFENCTFSGNGFGNGNKEPVDCAVTWNGSWGSEGPLTFSGCTFENNNNAGFLSGEWDTEGEYRLQDCTFSNNRWDEGTPHASPAQAVPTASTVLVNGEKKSFDAYNIAGNNYFKLRDLAYVLSGTDKQFEVGWDAAAKAISLTSGQAYTAVGGEMTGKGAGTKTANPSSARIILNGEELSLTAYEIGGNNYFKLRDIGQTFDFGVGWDGGAQTITIDTSTGYTAE